MSNILITSAGRRVSLLREFKHELNKYFHEGKVFACDMKPDLSSACYVADGNFRVPAVSDPSYSVKILDICKGNGISLIIPTIDTELAILSQHKNYFLSNGVIPVVSEPDIVAICRDKRKTHQFFDSIGFPRCSEIDPRNAVLPIFVKPADGSSSIGVRTINDFSELTETMVNDTRMMFVEYLNPSQFTEFTIDLYFDRKSNLKCAVPRERIEVRAGEVCKGITRRNELYDFILGKFNHCPGFIGCITLQVFRHNQSHDLFGIEINPRFGGGYPLSYHANANYPEMIIKEYLLNEEISFIDTWKDNILMLRFDKEIIVNDYKG